MISSKEYMKSRKPVLDKENKFMFFGNNKVCQRSICRVLLKDRVIICKNEPKKFNEVFDSYSYEKIRSIFKFTIVRNPLDKFVSAFFYLQQHPRHFIDPKISMTEFIHDVFQKTGPDYDPHFNFQYLNAYDNDGKCFVDYIGKFETIDESWKYISKKISAPQELPHYGKSKRKRNYLEYYDNETKKIVEEIYKRDTDKFYRMG